MVAIVIFASICFAWAYTSRARKRKEKVRPVLTRSLSIGALHGGRLALQRLIDYRDACADVNVLDAAEAELETSLAEERPDFKKLQVRPLGPVCMYSSFLYYLSMKTRSP